MRRTDVADQNLEKKSKNKEVIDQMIKLSSGVSSQVCVKKMLVQTKVGNSVATSTDIGTGPISYFFHPLEAHVTH